MRSFILVLLVLSVAACGTTTMQHYSGAPKSDQEIAIFSLWIDKPEYRGDFFPANLKVEAESINGETFQTNTEITVLPGSYDFKVKCDYKGAIKFHTYKIEAEAGKIYAVMVYRKDDECQFKNLKLLINNERFEDF
jgi:hypothetical protein